MKCKRLLLIIGPCGAANALSSTTELGYGLSRVCVLHDQSRLDGSVMTKAISIETAALAWLPADGPENLELRRSLPDRCSTNGSNTNQ